MTCRASLIRLRRCVVRADMLILAAMLLPGLACAPAAASEHGIIVIANKRAAVTALTREQVADIFLSRVVTETKWQPIDSSDEALREAFYQAIAGLSVNRVRAY